MIAAAAAARPLAPDRPRAACPTPSERATRRSSPPARSSAIPARQRWRSTCRSSSARLAEHRLARKSSSLGWLFGKREKREPPLKGLYVYGEVGRGKTMLMDLFFEASPVLRKRRAHFHEFMADVHERVHVFRQEIKNGEIADETIRSSSPPPRSPRRPGCCASTNSTSPTSPTP